MLSARAKKVKEILLKGGVEEDECDAYDANSASEAIEMLSEASGNFGLQLYGPVEQTTKDKKERAFILKKYDAVCDAWEYLKKTAPPAW